MAAARAPWGWAVAGALAGVLPAIVAFAPAQWLTQRLGAATGGQVQLTQARGTIWTGSAQLVLTGGGASQDSAALPGRLEWQLRPSWTGLRLQINATCCTPQPLLAQVRVQMGQVRVALQDSRSQWPAAVLAGLGTPWNTLQPQGQLMLQTRGWRPSGPRAAWPWPGAPSLTPCPCHRDYRPCAPWAVTGWS